MWKSCPQQQPFKHPCPGLTLQSDIKYTATIKIKLDGTIEATRCNCTFCQKLGTTNLALDGPSDFTLLSPKSTDEVGNYCPRVPTARKNFCKTCGVHVWQGGQYEFEGQTHDYFMINAASIDQPQEGVDLQKVKLTYWDGLHDNWHAGMKDTPYSGGLP